jgi:hypothetical protein
MMAWIGRRPRLAVRTIIRAVKVANDEQVRMWESVLLTSRAVPATVTGPLRWVPSLDGDRLAGSYLPTWDQSETGLHLRQRRCASQLAGDRGGGSAGGRCQRYAECHQRQYQRRFDHDRREDSRDGRRRLRCPPERVRRATAMSCALTSMPRPPLRGPGRDRAADRCAELQRPKAVPRRSLPIATLPVGTSWVCG